MGHFIMQGFSQMIKVEQQKLSLYYQHQSVFKATWDAYMQSLTSRFICNSRHKNGRDWIAV